MSAFDVFQVSDKVAELLTSSELLPFGVSAVADLAPEYELEELDALHVAVCPTHVYLADSSRGERRHQAMIQIGFIQRIREKLLIPPLVQLEQQTAEFFRHREFAVDGLSCHVTDTEMDPLYDPDRFRENGEFLGVVILEIEALEAVDKSYCIGN